ncbi:Endonuclease/Exonuclease/phosphatase family protein [Rubripirellula lacrimiformis]|uniref:Endonuclease/Exonuclease/phosphatase family protein n=1 Tax=Rubripirellula lacrimiformis TaxID=1930273 RepID=A0A517N410_9BACT|nr:endonuclease/exonuclease/phosphatase family protein [Rubripirellula lacrimiformis]QDT01873.1 Endonuclease/Exonuclease/phosphatase family protein [Rubripirellula lacrimiformis]
MTTTKTSRIVRLILSVAFLFAGSMANLAMADETFASGDERSTDGETNDSPIRLATYNASLYGKESGQIHQRLADGIDSQASKIAAIVQTVRPDILLINEIDHDSDSATAKLLAQRFFAVGQDDRKPILYPYVYSAPSNTGIPSRLDLDGDGKTTGPGDAWGFGVYPGQYSMAVFSRFPIEFDKIRTFGNLLWRDLPGALRPIVPSTRAPFHDDAIWNQLRLSSKNHIDVPVRVGDRVIHVLACHPTPPVFDGPEDRNGCRNHDEIQFWNEYTQNPTADFLVDDQGRRGGLPKSETFFIAGDLNSDPVDGDSRSDAIVALLDNPRLMDPQPPSEGGRQAAGGSRLRSPARGVPDLDTASFGRSGNMRIDYLLPSRDFVVRHAAVFWPPPTDPRHAWVTASDHRMVWVEVERPQ